jgi:hypothetical protein
MLLSLPPFFFNEVIQGYNPAIGGTSGNFSVNGTDLFNPADNSQVMCRGLTGCEDVGVLLTK